MNKQLVVKKTGVGQDRYNWDGTTIEFDHGVLVLRDSEGVMLHAYSPGAWLEIEVWED